MHLFIILCIYYIIHNEIKRFAMIQNFEKKKFDLKCTIVQ